MSSEVQYKFDDIFGLAERPQQSNSVLSVLDEVHRSLLMNDLQYGAANQTESSLSKNIISDKCEFKLQSNDKKCRQLNFLHKNQRNLFKKDNNIDSLQLTTQNNPMYKNKRFDGTAIDSSHTKRNKGNLMKKKEYTNTKNNLRENKSQSKCKCKQEGSSDGSSSNLSNVSHIDSSSTDEQSIGKKNKSIENDEDKSDSPIIHIVQEITEQRTIIQTIHINRKKAQQFGQCSIVRSKPVNRRKPRQKVDRENVQNEILAQQNQWDHNSLDGDVEHDSTIASIGSTDLNIVRQQYEEKMHFGKLEAANSRTFSRPVGRLMAKRIDREKQITFKKKAHNKFGDENGNRIAPIKPPRTFASSSKNSSDDSNTATTVPIEDISITPKNSNFSKLERLCEGRSLSPQPSCPTLDEIIESDKHKYGWISAKPDIETEDICNMLNYEQNFGKKCNITSFNLMPQPQSIYIPAKQSIDTVDSSPSKRSKLLKNCEFNTPLRDDYISSTSTPNQKTKLNEFNQRDYENFCKKCKLKINKEGKTTFKKNALKRTKSFFRASKRKIISNKRMLNPKNGLTDTEDYASPAKSEITVQMNKTVDESDKKSIKHLGFTPLKANESLEENTMESSQIYSEVLLHQPSPIKPARNNRRPHSADAKYLAGQYFDFERKISSPKQHQLKSDQSKRRFMLSPKRLFKTLNKSPSKHSEKSYRSFAENDDDFLIFMGEYLQRMQQKIEGKSNDKHSNDLLETQMKTLHCDPQFVRDIRKMSTSSNGLECISPKFIEANCNLTPEAIYAEIENKESKGNVLTETPCSHIIANNDPTAIYAQVNKIHNSKTPYHSTDSQISGEDYVCDLNLGNTLSVSIENLLDKIQLQSLDDSPITSAIEVEHSVLLHNAPQSPQDNSSNATFLTEDICDDVLRGGTINSEIACVINRIEKLDPLVECKEFKLAVPDSDDSERSESVFVVNCNETQHIAIRVNGNSKPMEVNSESRRSFESGDNLVSQCGIDDVDHPVKNSHHFEVQTNVQKSPLSHIISPNLKNLRNKLRDSFNRSANYFKSREFDEYRLNKDDMITVPRFTDQQASYLLRLRGQLAFQQGIRNQLNKAIEMCRTTRGFERSSELVEAERLLLLSYKKESAAKEQIEQLSSSDNLQFKTDKCSATISISDLKIPLKPKTFYDNYFNYFYLCICSYRDQVVATFTKERTGDQICFDNIRNIVFEGLEPDFNILLEIYVLRLHKHAGNVENVSKFGLSKIEKMSPILSPVKAFVAKTKSDTYKSKFRLQGSINITSDCLSSTEYIENRRNQSYGEKRHLVYYSSITKPFRFASTTNLEKSNINDESMTIGFDSEIRLLNSGLKGYLNVATGTGQYWSKLWAVVDGCGIYFWDNKDEQQDLSPNLSIDLTKCIMDSITLADKKTCAMPMTLVININLNKHKSNRNATDDPQGIQQYFIAANNNTELINWLTELNRIIEFIHDWNI